MAADGHDHRDGHEPDGYCRASATSTFLRWAAGTQFWSPSVFYNTIDSSGRPRVLPIDLRSAAGDFGTATFDSTTGTWSEDATITVQTNSVIDNGPAATVTVLLTHPLLCRVVANAAGTLTAAATIDEPQLQIYLNDAENPKPIPVTNGEPTGVEVGEWLWLTAQERHPGRGQLDGARQRSGDRQLRPGLSGGSAVGNWRTGGGRRFGLGAVSDADSITFEWVAGGPSTTNITATTLDEATTAGGPSPSRRMRRPRRNRSTSLVRSSEPSTCPNRGIRPTPHIC